MKAFIILAIVLIVGNVHAANKKQYAVYCNTETNWIYTTAATAPTNCPTSAAHSYRADSIRHIKEVMTGAKDRFKSEVAAETNSIAALWSALKALGESIGRDLD